MSDWGDAQKTQWRGNTIPKNKHTLLLFIEDRLEGSTCHRNAIFIDLIVQLEQLVYLFWFEGDTEKWQWQLALLAACGESNLRSSHVCSVKIRKRLDRCQFQIILIVWGSTIPSPLNWYHWFLDSECHLKSSLFRCVTGDFFNPATSEGETCAGQEVISGRWWHTAAVVFTLRGQKERNGTGVTLRSEWLPLQHLSLTLSVWMAAEERGRRSSGRRSCLQDTGNLLVGLSCETNRAMNTVCLHFGSKCHAMQCDVDTGRTPREQLWVRHDSRKFNFNWLGRENVLQALFHISVKSVSARNMEIRWFGWFSNSLGNFGKEELLYNICGILYQNNWYILSVGSLKNNFYREQE